MNLIELKKKQEADIERKYQEMCEQRDKEEMRHTLIQRKMEKDKKEANDANFILQQK